MLRRLVQLVSPRNCRKTTMITPVTPQTSRRARHHNSADFRMRVCSTPTGAQDLASDSNSLRTHRTDCTSYTIPLYNYHPEQTFLFFRTCEIVICQVSFFSAEAFKAYLLRPPNYFWQTKVYAISARTATHVCVLSVENVSTVESTRVTS